MRNALTPAFQLTCTLACLLALATGFGPLARQARQAGHAPAAGVPFVAARAAAQRVYIDLATGQLREPTAAELAAGNPRSAGGLQAAQKQALPTAPAAADEVQLPDGTVGVRPARQYLHTIELCRQADGSYAERCAGSGSTP